MNQLDSVCPKGNVEIIIDYSDGRPQEKLYHHNNVLRKGREALASSLANSFGNSYDFFISRMLFGDGGTTGGVPKLVNTERNGLFGVTRANKNVISVVDPNVPSELIITSVIGFNEANGYSINEMALQMSNGDLYSMATSPDLGKTSIMQITYVWRLSFI